MFITLGYLYIGFQKFKEFKSKDEVKLENERRNENYKERKNLEAIEFEKKVQAYENLKKLDEEQKFRIREMRSKAMKEYPDYFLFQNHVLKQFSPDRFRLNDF